MENINNRRPAIKEWNEDERPREKLLQHGPDTLSVAELLAIIINNGNSRHSALDLARQLLAHAGNRLGLLVRMSVKDLQKVRGIGPAKAVSIKAALQMAIVLQRENLQQQKRITRSADLVDYLRQELQHQPNEICLVVFLDRSNKILSCEKLSKGGISGTVVDPRVILRRAIEERASALVLSHNHPSGSLRPSKADLDITNKLKEAARLIDVQVLDHVIVSEEGYYSFADDGLI